MILHWNFILFEYLILFSSSHGSGHPVDRTLQLQELHLTHVQGSIKVVLASPTGSPALHGELGVQLENTIPKLGVCSNGEHCLHFENDLKLSVKKVKSKCHEVLWTSSQNITLEDCFSFGTAHWYGGPEYINQYWPVEKLNLSDFSYVNKMEDNTAITEPYWLNSEGTYIYVDPTVPLFIDTNNHRDNSICLISKQTDPYLPRDQSILKYTVCSLSNAKVAHRHAIKNFWDKPEGIPDTRMVEHPIWSTWVRYKLDVSDAVIRQFAQEIVDNGFNNSQLEIDDNWETCYGSAQFNTSRFPKMKKLTSYLKSLGFRVTLWNHPFINTNCELFTKAKELGHLVKDQNGNVVSTWWDGEGGVVDFTNTSAVKWFKKLRDDMMTNNGIDSMKFDAGESSWLPQIPSLNVTPNLHPKGFSAKYVEAVAQFSPMIEVRVGDRTQKLAIFVRMLDKDSKWDFRNGLATLLTTLFQMNIVGYPFVLPDMVGGNAYSGDIVTKEMFIRWLQATTFMPSIQFSVTPWDFDDETVKISKIFTQLHYQYSGKIIELMNKSVETGDPINMPIWWVDPTDKTAQACWSEYLLGEDILVAPVIEEGATQRDIYLPKGKWRDESKPQHKVYKGRKWLRNYKADLSTLPYFTRVG
uniref:Glycoside hydrolase family 31 N-terminal domain-containing protein n=1 Tax=Clastoptera arizonana TaxID=38151 RepID=A0A1B6CDQ5_9HEMI